VMWIYKKEELGMVGGNSGMGQTSLLRGKQKGKKKDGPPLGPTRKGRWDAASPEQKLVLNGGMGEGRGD